PGANPARTSARPHRPTRTKPTFFKRRPGHVGRMISQTPRRTPTPKRTTEAFMTVCRGESTSWDTLVIGFVKDPLVVTPSSLIVCSRTLYGARDANCATTCPMKYATGNRSEIAPMSLRLLGIARRGSFLSLTGLSTLLGYPGRTGQLSSGGRAESLEPLSNEDRG